MRTFTANDLPVGITRRGALHVHGVTLGMHGKAFLAAQRQLYRAAAVPGQQRGVMLYGEILFAAESSANILADDSNFLTRNTEHLHDALMIVVNTLASGINRKRAALRWNGECALRLQKGVLLMRR